MSDNDLDIEDFFEDEETLELFRTELESNGLVASSLSEGVIVAFSAEKLEEFVKLANDDSEKRVIIFIGNKVPDQDPPADLIN